MFASKNELFTRPSGSYQISRSVRTRSSASAYFNRTPTVAGNSRTWTLSTWVKRGALGSTAPIFYAGAASTSSDQTAMQFRNDDTLQVLQNNGATTVLNKITSAVYRDPSAWYHIVLTFDTSNATAEDRVRMYINGVRVTSFSSNTNISLSGTTYVNDTVYVNRLYRDYTTTYQDGYLTEVNFIDGTALTPSSFGSTNAITGVWQPAKYTGTYGTNGFYLNFSDNSAATAATIGKDYSGNANNWTPNNISVTAGTTYDSMLDVPTLYADGGNGRGNYPTMNPISATNQSRGTVADANLTGTVNTSAVVLLSTFEIPSSVKVYVEFTAGSGISSSAAGLTDIGVRGFNDNYTQTDVATYLSDARKTVDAVTSAYGATYTTNDIIGMAIDAANKTIEFFKNNTSQGVVTYTGTYTTLYMGLSARGGTAGARVGYINFGQRPFTYTPPSGYVALNTQNLPTPTISNGANYMAATKYTGNGTSQSVSNAVNSISFQPDWVWIKDRTTAGTSNILQDSIRGTSKYLVTNTTGAEGTQTTLVTAFNSNGFSVGNDGSVNANTDAQVAWQWKAGTTSASNTNGSITSTVSAGATQGFSVVTYTGNGTAGATRGHGLGVTPAMIILKSRSAVGNWPTYHQNANATPQNGGLFLNATDAFASAAGFWNNTAPTSTVFSTGGGGDTNANGTTYVAYCFSAVAGYSAFGSYTGNGSTDGPFVYLGFRPRFVMIKRTDSTGNWQIIDTSRSPYNEAVATLYPNLTNAEDLTNTKLDALSNGFKIRGTPSTDFNTNGSTYIYACFAENPFKLSLAR